MTGEYLLNSKIPTMVWGHEELGTIQGGQSGYATVTFDTPFPETPRVVATALTISGEDASFETTLLRVQEDSFQIKLTNRGQIAKRGWADWIAIL